MSRRVTMLAALLALQVALIAFFSWPRGKENQQSVRLLELAPESIVSLTIRDSQGKSLSLQRQKDQWLVQPPENYPGSRERIGAMVEKLTSLSSSQLVSASRGSHARLKVSPQVFNRRIELQDTEGRTHLLYLGTDQGMGVHVLKEGGDAVYFVRGLSSWELATETRSWWQTQLTDLPAEAITFLELRNEHGSFSLQRGEDGSWSVTGEVALDQDKVRNLVDEARSVTLNDYLSLQTREQLDHPVLNLTLDAKEQQPLTLTFGPASESGDHLARRSDNGRLVRVNRANINGLLQAKIAGLTAEKDLTN